MSEVCSIVIAGVEVTMPKNRRIRQLGRRFRRPMMTPDVYDDKMAAAIEMYLGMELLAPSKRTLVL